MMLEKLQMCICFALLLQQRAESYQNNRRCRSNKSIEEPPLQGQPAAAGKEKNRRKWLTPTTTLASKLMACASAGLHLPQPPGEGRHMPRRRFPTSRRIIKRYRESKQCSRARHPAGTQLTRNWGSRCAVLKQRLR